MLLKTVARNMGRNAFWISNPIQSRAFSLQVDQIKKIGVVGAGQLGSGIGLVAASKLPDTVVQIVDSNEK